MSDEATGQRRRRGARGRPQAAPASGRRAAPTPARLVALRVLERVERGGAYLDLALRSALTASALPGRDRALVTELVYGVLRWRGHLDHLLGFVLTRDLAKLEPAVASVLRLGAYQIAFADRIPASAAVDEAVRCARAAGLERATGLVNAVLRQLARSYREIPIPSLAADPLGHLVHGLSVPVWIAERWIDLLGPEEAAALARASNRVAPLTVRCNRLRTRRDLLLWELRARFPNAAACRFAPDGVVLGRRGNAGLDPAFREGRFTIQDEASQLVVELLAPESGEQVLDTCAAPGTKATAVAERVGVAGQVVALDRNPRRLGLVSRDARRLGLANLQVQVADATRPLRVRVPPAGFDRVLVDAPCSGLGTLRRNPDLRWRLRPADPVRLSHVQTRILEQGSALLRPGGTLVYSTCTLLPEENEAVVRDFVRRRREFRLLRRDELPEPLRQLADEEGFVRSTPHLHDMDGFVSARLERRP